MHTQKFTNRLIHETSPYLLQHAHNPVDWYPWGEEALQRAAEEDKPILVSIGYSACHWCHVMERESFEDEATAEIMNKYFVNIKIDREERPDLDHIYMDAVQAMTGSGGWPLNVFLTPDARPFYGGTYFPPVRAYNRMSWKETLQSVYEIFTDRRDEAELQANNLTQHIASANSFGMTASGDSFFNRTDLQTMAENLLAAADKQWGGFGRAPKFPQTFSIQYLLRHYHYTKDGASLDQALLSLDKMMQGGIYDHLGGGFARYSTDEKWLAPHFEKMLYDNALLISVLAEAYQLTKQEKYKSCIAETVTFIERELMHEGGGFYSALDADSEGVEGKFYTWSKAEINEILGNDADIFCTVYNVTGQGNWEHTNILWLPATINSLAKTLQVNESALEQKLAECRKKLLEQRVSRIRPQLDDKVLAGWNALMISALCKAAAATGEQKFRLMAERSIVFAEQNFRTPEGLWLHTWKNGEAKYMAFLDDLAALVQAYLQLAVVTGSERYLRSAKALTINIIDDFSDDAGVFFLFTSRLQDDVIVRKKEVYDGATPSGNALMAENLFQLSVYFDISVWKDRAIRMGASLKTAISRYPSSFGVWAMFAQATVYGMNEIAVVGENAFDMLSPINQLFIPNKVLMATTSDGDENYPLLRSKPAKEGEIQLYLCKDFVCKQPVKSVPELIFLLNQMGMQ